jgi:DNA polymerase
MTSTLVTQLSKAKSPTLRRVLVQKIAVSNLKSSIESCRACPLGHSRTRSVPLDGPTHGRADLILVGEAPGYNEDKYGRPFVGQSGRILDRLLETVGSERKRCVVFNTLCCRPPSNRDPSPDELAACRPNFDAQLSMTGLWIGVALGGYALANVMGVARSSIRIGEYLDRPVWVNGRVWFGTYHPAYAMRNSMAKRDIALSLRAALALRWSEAPLPLFSYATNQKDRDKEALDTLADLMILGDKRIGPHLHKKGWAFGYSQALGERIVVTGGEDILIKKGIPPALAHYPRYTLSELLRIGDAGAARGGWRRSEMRRLAMVRDEFGGEIIA